MNRKTLPILLIVFLLTAVVTLIPEIIGDDMVQWCEENLKPKLGENYKVWLFGIIIVALVILTFLTTDLNVFYRSKNADGPLSLSPEENEQNYQTIRQYLCHRYERRLNQKLAGRQPVNLRRITTDEGTSEETSATFVTYQSEEIGPTLAHDFREAHGRLLVTGAPGAGKTTLLLQLALELNATEREYLPVLLNLATWSDKFNSLDEWLREILPAELGVTKKYAAEILKQDRLQLLLDGFDEIKKDYRSSCLEAIGIYGAEAGRRYIISSRKNEYKEVEKDAPVWLQVEVGPLTFAQLEAELKRISYHQPEAPFLLQVFQNDPLLREAAQVPFYFNTLQLLFSGGKKLSDFNFKKNTVEGRQAEIIECFVERKLNVKNSKKYNSEKVRHYLSFFASRLTQRNMVVFELVDLQYDWWRWGALSNYFKLQAKGLATIILNIFFVIVFAHFYYFAYLFHSLINESNPTWDYTSFLWIAFIFHFLIMAPFLYWKKKVKILCVENFKYKKAKDMLFPLLISFLMGILFVGALEMAYGIYPAFFFGIMFFIALGNLFTRISNNVRLPQITTPYQRFTASAKALHFSILQHWLLRWQLYRAGVLPLRLVDFLNEMSERHLLETDGATWRFRHRILQEYFANIWEGKMEDKKTSSASPPPISSTKKI